MFQQTTTDENSDWAQSVTLPNKALLGQSDENKLLLPTTERKVQASTDWDNAPKPPTAGKVFLVGGGYPVPENIRMSFLRTVSEACGGRDFKDLTLVIIPSASGDFFEKEGTDKDRQERLDPWTKLGVSDIQILNALSPDESKGPDFSNPIASADAVWITGGDQKRLSYLYCDTPVEEALIKLLNRGGVVGGSSAGAAIMCNPMICGEDPKPIMGRGFPFVNAVIDQHFSQRKRENRLKSAVSETVPYRSRPIGIGIDEHSAIIWDVKLASVKALPNSVAFYYENESVLLLKETETVFSSGTKKVGNE